MRLLAIVHGYPPLHNAGAEWMLHHMFTNMVRNGHTCSVSAPNNHQKTTFEGVTIYDSEKFDKDKLAREHDIVFSHLGLNAQALNHAQKNNRAFIHISHNNTPYGIMRIKTRNTFVIYNSQHLKDALCYSIPGVVVYPPTTELEYKTDNKDANCVTLINHNYNKGGDFVIKLAKRLPNVKFLFVQGGYEDQIKDHTVKNIEYHASTSDMKSIYARTKVLLVPSIYESWGRVATEAICNGIPVIAKPTPGLKENLQNAGLFIDRNDIAINQWVETIEKLFSDRDFYENRKQKALKRYAELQKDMEWQMLNFEYFLAKTVILGEPQKDIPKHWTISQVKQLYL